LAEIRICTDCGEKPFYAKGLCRPCYDRRYRREHPRDQRAYLRRYHEKNREKHLVQMRHYDQEHREEKRAYNHQYYLDHQEEGITYTRRYREEHPDHARRYREDHQEEEIARHRRWAQENPDKCVAKTARRRALKRNLPNTLTPQQAQHLFAIGHAMYPGEELHLDHIVPLDKGGGTTLANMHAIPARLNQSKHDALPQEIYKQGEMLSIVEMRNG
jgi:hypothetical protein